MVKILMPPSIGIQGGGQHSGRGPEGGPGCEKQVTVKIINTVTIVILFIKSKNMFLFTLNGMFMLKLDICNSKIE